MTPLQKYCYDQTMDFLPPLQRKIKTLEQNLSFRGKLLVEAAYSDFLDENPDVNKNSSTYKNCLLLDATYALAINSMWLRTPLFSDFFAGFMHTEYRLDP